MSRPSIGLWLVPVIGLLATPVAAWERREHEILADSCLAIVLGECRFAVDCADSLALLLEDLSPPADFARGGAGAFGALSGGSASRDGSRSRYQPRGRSVLDQLREVDSEALRDLLARHLPPEPVRDGGVAGWPAVEPVETRSGSVVANFLVHHLVALHYAALAGRLEGDEKAALRRALVYEAAALGCLSDAFASPHILQEPPGLFGWLHPVNTADAHAFYRNHGAYVLDSRGDQWQTFGDKLLEWHRPTRDHVWVACTTSLRELFYTYYSASAGAVPESLARWARAEGVDAPDRNPARWLEIDGGATYYESLRMPALLRIPMATVATWSVRTDVVDAAGIHERKHFPQLRDAGLHDPSLAGVDDAFLFPRASMPHWLVLSRLEGADARALIRSDPDVASVCLVQERHRKPSYRGGLASLGLAQTIHGPSIGAGWTVGLGYAFIDEMIPLRHLPSMGRASAELSYQPNVGGGSGSLISPALAIQVDIPRFPNLHLDTGYAWASDGPSRRHGMRTGIGISTETQPLGFTFAGVSLRARYQWAFLGEIVGGMVVETVVH